MLGGNDDLKWTLLGFFTPLFEYDYLQFVAHGIAIHGFHRHIKIRLHVQTMFRKRS